MSDFPFRGDTECPHPKKDRRDVRYAVICDRCGAVRGIGNVWRVRK